MQMFLCSFDYATRKVRGWGEMVVLARDAGEAETKAKMRAGAWSEATMVRVRPVDGGIHELFHKTKDVEEVENAHHERSVARRYVFSVAAAADVVAVDMWDAYRKLGRLVAGETPAPGLKRKVLEKTPVEDISRRDANEIFKATRFLQGGATRPR